MKMQNRSATSPVDGPLEIYRDAQGRLVLSDDKGTHVGVKPIRLFPISDQGHWIALCDSDGRELASIADPSVLPEETLRLLVEEIAQNQFMPVIERVVRVTHRGNQLRWEVDTDRGLTVFQTGSEDEVRHLGLCSVLIHDIHGVRYLIPNTDALDTLSRRIIEHYLY